MRLKRGFGKREKIVIEHVDLDQLNLIVDGEKLTEVRAAVMGEELAREAHRLLKLKENQIEINNDKILLLEKQMIKLPDSLKFQTLLTKRTVYGGGGILPDIFVPLDTTEITDYFRSLVQTGLMNNFTMDYIEKNRDGLKSSYSSFESFNSDFKVDESFMKTFFAYVAKEYKKLVFNEKEYATSAKLIKLRIKAQIAQNAYGINEFYQVFNESDEIIQRAVQALTTKEYSKAKLKN